MILASASPRRLELITACGIEARVCPADIDETPLVGEHPRQLVERLARQKAHAALDALGGCLDDVLLAADTIVWDDGGDVLGKPSDEQDAVRMLRILSGATHHVSTGVCLLVPAEVELLEESFVETTDVTFCDLSEGEIRAYVSSGEPLDKAGAYGIQVLGRLLVRGIDGDYPNVVGLPVNHTLRVLDRLLVRVGRDGVITKILEGSHA